MGILQKFSEQVKIYKDISTFGLLDGNFWIDNEILWFRNRW